MLPSEVANRACEAESVKTPVRDPETESAYRCCGKPRSSANCANVGNGR
jgi:hypothetical protein